MFFITKKEPVNYDELATIFRLYMERNLIPDSTTDRIIIQALTSSDD